MPQHTEAEQRRRARRRVPRPGTIRTSGGGPSEFLRDLKRSAGNVFADTIAEGREAATEIAEAASRFGESPARSGEAVRRVISETGEGVLQTGLGLLGDVADPARVREKLTGVGRGIGGFFGIGLDRPPETVEKPDQGPVGPPVAEREAAPVTTADAATARVLPGPPAAPEESKFAETGDLKDLPPGFAQIIKGTSLGFSDAAGNQFRAIPGLSPEESQQAAAARDPGRQQLVQEDIQRTRVNSESLRAASDAIRAKTESTELGFNEQGELRRFAVNADGTRSEVPIEPFVEAMLTSQNDLQIVQVGTINPLTGLPAEQTLLVDLTNATVLGNFSKEIENDAAEAMFVQLGGNANSSEDDMEEILEEIEKFLGPQLNLRRSLGLFGQ